MRTVRSKTLANAMDQKTRSNRALGKQNREQLSEESRFQKSREIAENLMATAVWKQAKQVLLYASYGSEVSTGLLMDAALAAGKEVFLPKVLGDQMEFFRITDRAELAPGYQHILEPPGQTKRFLPDASIPTLLTAPGLAFDRSGARIGYGKGFYDRYLSESHEGLGKVTVTQMMEKSANGIAKVLFENYNIHPEKFVNRWYGMGLDKKTGICLPGEADPFIKYPKDKSWTGITLPWMSIGYELKLTPLQILAFYNAIANNGQRMRPRFVKEIRHWGQLVEQFEPEEVGG